MLKYPYKLFTENYNLYNQNDEQSHKITKPKTFSNVKHSLLLCILSIAINF